MLCSASKQLGNESDSIGEAGPADVAAALAASASARPAPKRRLLPLQTTPNLQHRAGGPPLPFHGSFPPTGLPQRPVPQRSCPVRSSVKAFGARGDGRTSDVTALQRANRARGSSVLYFPPGTYRLTRSLVLSKTVLAGETGLDSIEQHQDTSCSLGSSGWGFPAFHRRALAPPTLSWAEHGAAATVQCIVNCRCKHQVPD